MNTYTCDICNEIYTEEELNYTKNKSKCILHTNKQCLINNENVSENTSVYFFERLKKFVDEKNTIILNNIDFFPITKECISVFNQCDEIIFSNCTFHSKMDDDINTDLILRFVSCTFINDWMHLYKNKVEYINCNFKSYKFEESIKDIGSIFLEKCNFKNDFLITSKNDNKEFTITEINLEDSIFKKKVKIQYCEIEEGNFYHTKFKDLADFYQSKFKKVNFEETDFEGITIFTNVEFNCDVFFTNTKFLSSAIFRDKEI